MSLSVKFLISSSLIHVPVWSDLILMTSSSSEYQRCLLAFSVMFIYQNKTSVMHEDLRSWQWGIMLVPSNRNPVKTLLNMLQVCVCVCVCVCATWRYSGEQTQLFKPIAAQECLCVQWFRVADSELIGSKLIINDAIGWNVLTWMSVQHLSIHHVLNNRPN